MRAKIEKRNFLPKNHINLGEYEQVFNDFVGNSSDHSLLKALANENFLSELQDLIKIYTDQKYFLFKKEVNFNSGNDTPFTILSMPPNNQKFLEELDEAISNTNQFSSTREFSDALEIIILFQFFTEFKQELIKSAARLTEQEQLLRLFENSFAEFVKNAEELKALLLKTDDKRIRKKIKVNEKKPQRVKHEERSFQNRTIIHEPDFSFQMQPRSLGSRIWRYISSNPKKIIFGSITTMIAVGLFLYFAPITIPFFLAVTITSVAFGGVLGGFLTGLFHYLLDKKARIYVHAPHIVPIDPNAEEKSLRRKMGIGPKLDLEPQCDKNDKEKENLLNFLQFLDYPASVAASLGKSEIISLIKSKITYSQIDYSALAEKYFKQKSRSSEINFDLLVQTCNNNLPPFDITKKINLETIKIQMQLIRSPLNQDKKEKLNSENLNSVTKLQEGIKNYSPSKLAEIYFLKSNKNKWAGPQFEEAVFSLLPEKKVNYEEEVHRIRKALVHFIHRAEIKPDCSKLETKALLEQFFETIKKLKTKEAARIYFELYITAPKICNSSFIPKILNESPQEESKQLLNEINIGKQVLFNSVKLFLNALSSNQELPLKEMSLSQLITNVKNKLKNVSVDEVVSIYSELRFNIFTDLDIDGINKIIYVFYDQTDHNKGKEYSEKVKKIDEEQYKQKEIHPRLIILKTFVGRFNKIEQTNFNQLQAEEILKDFYNTLRQLSVTELTKLLSDLSSAYKIKPKHFEFLLQVIYNFLDLERPQELGELQKSLYKLNADIQFNSSKGSCSLFFKKNSKEQDQHIVVNEQQSLVL